MKLYVAELTPGVTTLGPGRRVALWVEGCSLRCTGCLTPELFERRPRSAHAVAEVAERIIALAPGHDGLTISGGEPFEQADALGLLVERLRRETTLDVLAYSGYRRDEIEGGSRPQRRLLRSVDMLIDGRYEDGRPTYKPWRGSDNQVLHLLTPRAADYRASAERTHEGPRTLQVGFSEDGRLQIVGVPHRGLDSTLRRELGGRGLSLAKRRRA